MIVRKILNGIKSKKIIDLKYIIVEIALIFSGITLAAKYNQYQSDLQDEKFLKEVIKEIYSEIKQDYEVNNVYFKFEKERIKKIKELKTCLLDKNLSKIIDKENKQTLLTLSRTLSLSNINLGFKKLQEKNINLVKNENIKNELISYYNMMEYNQMDLNVFNNDILNSKSFLFKHFKNYDYLNLSFDKIIDVNKLFSDDIFVNQINYIILDYQTNIETNEFGIIPKSKKIITDLEKEYEFLKQN